MVSLHPAAHRIQGKHRAFLPGEIELHNDLQPRFVEGLHQLLEFFHRVFFLPGAVGRLRGEHTALCVTPVIDLSRGFFLHIGMLPGSLRHHHFLKLHRRQQLHRGHPQILQIGDLLRDGGKSAVLFCAGRRMSGESAHMKAVDHRVLVGNLQRPVSLPVKLLPVQRGFQGFFRLCQAAPFLPAAEGCAIGIRLKGSVRLVGIFQSLEIAAHKGHVPHVPRLVLLAEGYFLNRGCLSRPVEHQSAALLPGCGGKMIASSHSGGPQRIPFSVFSYIKISHASS